jgi:uncharacterized protein (TIGR00369 family)
MNEHARKPAFGPFHEVAVAGDSDDAPPEGFERMPTFGPYHQLLGPMYWRRADDGMLVGLRVQDKHRNRGQMMHGGMICTLADTASHWAAKHAREPLLRMLTTGLNVSLMGNAGPGEWVEAHARVMRAGRSLVFTDCRIASGSGVIAQASAQFQIIGEDPAGAALR